MDELNKALDLPLEPLNTSNDLSVGLPAAAPTEPQESGIFAVKTTDNVKQVADIMLTQSVLKDEAVVNGIAREKVKELNYDAKAKTTKAEADFIAAKSQKADKEAQDLDKQAAKALAFFKANKTVLNIIGIREPLGCRTMGIFYCIALPFYILFCIAVSFPVAIAIFFIDLVIDTVGNISKKVTTTFLKVTTGLLSVGLGGAVITAFVFVIKFILKF